MLARSLGRDVMFAHCDVSLRPDIDALVRSCVDQFGPPDIVVNNAGTTHTNMPLLDVDEATFDKVFAVNVKSIYYMVLAVVPLMRKRGSGVILNVGSTADPSAPGLTRQNASKGSLNLLSKSLHELGPDPRSRSRTPIYRNRRNRPARTIHGHARIHHRIGEDLWRPFLLAGCAGPCDVAAAAVLLASDATNSELTPVDGARTA